jgi:hypothetical protein
VPHGPITAFLQGAGIQGAGINGIFDASLVCAEIPDLRRKFTGAAARSSEGENYNL